MALRRELRDESGASQPEPGTGSSLIEARVDRQREPETWKELLLGALGKLVALNDRLEPVEDGDDEAGFRSPSIWMCRTKPSLSLRDYLERILRYCQCSPASCVSAAVYIQRMAARDPHLVANSRTIHRLLLVGVIIATKFLDDRYFPNAYYAKVGGLTPAEVNELERDVLARLDFRVAVSAQDLQRCLAWLKHVHSAPPSSAGDPPALDVADSPASPAQPAAAAAAARLLSPDREFRGVRERVASYQDHMEGLWDGASSTARSSRLEGAARDSEAAEDGKCGTRAMTDESAGTPRLRSNEGAGSSGGVSEGGGEGCAQGRRRSHAEEATAVPPARATRDAASMPRTQG